MQHDAYDVLAASAGTPDLPTGAEIADGDASTPTVADVAEAIAPTPELVAATDRAMGASVLDGRIVHVCPDRHEHPDRTHTGQNPRW